MAKIENVIKHIDSVAVQYLDECFINFKSKKYHNEITFGTTSTFGEDRTDKVAIIIWADRSEMQKAFDIAESEENKA